MGLKGTSIFILRVGVLFSVILVHMHIYTYGGLVTSLFSYLEKNFGGIAQCFTIALSERPTVYVGMAKVKFHVIDVHNTL